MRSANPPPLHGTRIEELLRRDDAVALEDDAVLHHERHTAQSVDVRQRVPFHCDQVGARPALIGPEAFSVSLTL